MVKVVTYTGAEHLARSVISGYPRPIVLTNTGLTIDIVFVKEAMPEDDTNDDDQSLYREITRLCNKYNGKKH